METTLRRVLLPLVLVASVLLGSTALARAQVVYSGNGFCRDIALTYDTEFTGYTQGLIDTIDELGIPTTWFFLGDSVSSYPGLVQQVAARHQVGNHSYNHPMMAELSHDEIHWQLTRAEEMIGAVSGRNPEPIFRPPYGNWDSRVVLAAEEEGYPYTVMWSVDTRDWAGPAAETIRQRIVSGAHPGGIVLMHGSPRNTAEGTRLAVPQLKEMGYQFVTVTEILGLDRDLRDFGGTYVVQPGDTADWVARCHNVTEGRLMAYNEVPELWAGWTLRIPHRDEVIVRLNGARLQFPVYPRLRNQRAMAHVRLAEQLGAAVAWDGARVIITRDGRRMEITPGEQTALVDGQPVDMGAVPFKESDRVLAPVRFLVEQLGASVGFDGATYTVHIAR